MAAANTNLTTEDKYVLTQIRKNVSPLRYPGGKRKFFPYLAASITANKLQGSHYFEPYAGGAGAALELLRCGVVSRISLNDKDPAIYWFWKAVLTEGEKFMDLIETIDITVSEWRNQREILRSKTRGFALGFAAFYLNRTCVSGVIKRCGGPIGGYSQSGKYLINCRFHRASLKAKVEFLWNNRDKISIRNMDAISFLRRYAIKEEDSITYLDPPYYHKAGELYLNSYSHEDHESLRDFLLGDFQDKFWILSYDHCPEILEIYRHHSHASIRAHHALANKGRKMEFITSSDRLQLPKK